ncbi:acetyl-CoA carboxylase, carboxyltransferase subunit beta [Crocinitomix catalasitica]|uniref:acetyl-CoA carboxylase, carboxyltransferase subunit beta n=1 Tax=Crocinitomix catalasitica TaxID=184607 RepID=UPI0004882228|nr:acetyl-CoA carboxylase, carboxyltransferase subunit beta [Crocinitomix catalasitica]
MGWFTRKKEGISTSTADKKKTPEGLWYKCPKCKAVIPSEDHHLNFFVCSNCDHHERISASDYFEIFFDSKKGTEFARGISSADPLKFEDTKKYVDRVKQVQEKTGLKDAMKTAYGKMNNKPIVIAAMDFGFIGGSMGSVVGEKIARSVDKAIELNCPLMIISKSGGARMMEAGLSLMQMAKTSAKLNQLSKAKLPFISLLTDPTTGGVTASFAMLGDINIAEPNALIAFAGPRVVKETIGRDLPVGFQKSEFVLEHGFLDLIVHRKDLKDKIESLIDMFEN